jgi:hypothetical protein
MKVPSYYLYKCVNDDGGAPCIYRGRYSLSICKPAIRRTADVGDIIFAFGSNNNEDPPNRLVYIAVVSEVVRGGAYFELPKFASRPDCIYRRKRNGEFVLRSDAQYHTESDQRRKDLGNAPSFPNACTLLASDFRYFGASGTDDWKHDAPQLARLVENLGQGHRVRLGQGVRDELRLLKERIWRRFPGKKVLGRPLHATGRADTTESNEIVEVCGSRCGYSPRRRKEWSRAARADC